MPVPESEGKETDKLIGTVIQDRYRIERLLGEGGMGSVYSAEHLLIGKRVAIKCLNPSFASEPSVVERFRREARAATAIGHPHIIDVTDMGDLPDGSPFIVMEHLDGREFGDLLEVAGPLPIGRAIRVAVQVCDAIAAAHDKGIVHRDLKPENIFLIRRGTDPDFVKVLDFGISKMQTGPGAVQSLTQTGIAMGTPHYMSPEQAQGLRTMDHRTDIYALGVILYRALTGHPPFDAETYPMLLVQVMTTEARSVRAVRSDVPPELDSVILRSLAKKPEQRQTDARVFADELRPFLDLNDPPQMTGPAMAPTVRPPAPRTQPGGSDAPPGSGPRIHRDAPTQDGPAPPPRAIDLPKSETLDELPAAAARGEDSPQEETPSEALAASTEIVRPRSGRALRWTGVAALLLGTVGAAAWWASTSSDPRASAASDVQVTRPAASSPTTSSRSPNPSPAERQAPQAPNAPAEVRIRIRATPAESKIFIGEQEFPNPMDVPRPRSLEPARIRVMLEGHETVEELAVFDRDQSFNYRLRKTEQPRRGSRRPAQGSRGSSAPPTTRGKDGIYRGRQQFRDDW